MGKLDDTLGCWHRARRREFLRNAAVLPLIGKLSWPGTTVLAESLPASASEKKWPIPGPFPGQVVEVKHSGSITNNVVNSEVVHRMVERGMQTLTGADHPVDAWRSFFERGDVVGIKVNPVGLPRVISSPEIIRAIVQGLDQAGVKRKDIIVFDRYRDMFINSGYPKSIPEGVRWDAAVEKFDTVQTDLKGYDPESYVQLPLIVPGQDPGNPVNLRSHPLMLIRQVNKIVSIPCLKDHSLAGVTLALKQMSHGLVNNVFRSHVPPTRLAIVAFTPGVVSMPAIRSKVVLHILDGLRGCYQGGPSVTDAKYTWEQRTIWFATDPVAMDRIGWEVIDAKRTEAGLSPVAQAPPNQNEGFLYRQPQYIEVCGALGLGVYNREKIDLRKIAMA